MERYLAVSKEQSYLLVFKGGHRCYDAINIGDIYSRKHESFFYRNHIMTDIRL